MASTTAFVAAMAACSLHAVNTVNKRQRIKKVARAKLTPAFGWFTPVLLLRPLYGTAEFNQLELSLWIRHATPGSLPSVFRTSLKSRALWV